MSRAHFQDFFRFVEALQAARTELPQHHRLTQIKNHMKIPRRSFLAGTSAALGAMVAVPGWPFRSSVDELWLRGLNGQHRQFFDCGNHGNGKPLSRVANFIDVYEKSYAVSPSRVNAVLGVHGTAIPLVIADQAWKALTLGVHYDLIDPATRQPALRNIFGVTGAATPATIESLQAQNVRVIVCRKSIERLARELAARGIGNADGNFGEISRSVLPGVTIVPAMIVAANRAQEEGLTYVCLS